MKAGWQTKSLGDVCQLIGGGTPSKDNADYYTGDIAWATVRDMRSELIFETEFKITKEAVKNSATNIIPKGNVVIATRVGLGKVCLVQQDTAINQDLRGIVPIDKNILSVQFLFSWLKSISHKIVDEGTGATVQGVKLPFVKSLEISIAPLAEQQRIVAILDQAFEGIAKARTNAVQNLQNARALFESQLQSVFNHLGEAWPEKRLDKVAKVVSGYSFKSSDFSSTNQIKTIKITNVGVKEFVDDFDSLLPSSFKNKYDAFTVNSGSIVIALTRTIIQSGLKVAVVPNTYNGALLNQRVAAIIANCEYALDSYLYLYLSTKQVEQYVINHVNTLMQPNLSINDLKALSIPLPAIVEQKKIVRDLEILSHETKRLEALYQRKIALLDELKKSLLQQAFAGKL